MFIPEEFIGEVTVVLSSNLGVSHIFLIDVVYDFSLYVSELE